jgi:hypothetical protein
VTDTRLGMVDQVNQEATEHRQTQAGVPDGRGAAMR